MLPQPEVGDLTTRVVATIYASSVSVEAEPGSQLTLVLKDSTGVEKGRAEVDITGPGFFSVDLKDPRGEAVLVLGGDSLEITSVQGETTVISIVPLVVRANWTTDRVFGQAPAGETITVTLLAPRGGVGETLISRPIVGANGYFEVDYTETVGLVGGDQGVVSYRDAHNNIIRLEFSVPVIKVQERGSLVEGAGLWHDAAEVEVRLLSEDGTVRTVVTASTSLRSDLLGADFQTELRDRLGNSLLIQPGDRLDIQLPDVTFRVTTVPLTARVDVVGDRITGEGPAQARLEVELCRLRAGCQPPVSVSTDADGSFVADFGPAVDIRNGDYGNVTYTDPEGQSVWVRYAVPWIHAQEGSPFTTGFVAPGTPISVTLTAQHGALRGEGFATSGSTTGYFRAGLRSPWDRKVQIQAGDRLTVQLQGIDGAVAIDIPLLTAVVDADLLHVRGDAPSDATLLAELHKASGGTFQTEVEADSTGRYQASFSPQATIEAGDTGFVYYTLPSGHQISTFFDVPWIWLLLDNGSIGGQALPNVRVTGLLRNPSGAVVATGATQADQAGEFSLTTDVTCGVSGRPVPGSRLDLAFADWHIQLDIPALTANVDASQDVISGLAPAGGLVRVRLQSRWTPTQQTYASASGEYAVNFQQIDLRANDYGYVAHVDPAGHEIRRSFAVPGVELQPGVNRITGRMPPDAQFLATLYDSTGVEKGVGQGHASEHGFYSVVLQDAEGQPAPVEAGDHLEMSINGHTVLAVDVPALSVYMEAGSNRVTGTGPPLQGIDLQLYRNLGQNDQQTVTTDGSGQYAVEFEGPAFAPGDYVRVYASDAEGSRIFDRANTLWMSLEIESNRVSGRADLGSDVTIQLKDGSGTVRARAEATAARDSGQFSAPLYDAGGRAVLISASDQVEITADDGSRVQVSVPPLTLTPAVQADTVTGVAPAGSVVRVTLSSIMGGAYPRQAIANTTGEYAVSLRPFGNVRYGDSVSISYTSPEGFPILRRYALPWLNVELNTNHVEGRAPYSTTVNLRLLSAGGEELASTEVPTGPAGTFDAHLLDSMGSPATVQSRDVVQLVIDGVVPVQFVVPELIAGADLLTASVAGSAAPGSPARVELRSGGCTYTQEVLADDTGAFLARFRHIANLTVSDSGSVYWNSIDGNAVFGRFKVSAPSFRMFLPLLVN